MLQDEPGLRDTQRCTAKYAESSADSE